MNKEKAINFVKDKIKVCESNPSFKETAEEFKNVLNCLEGKQ